MDQLSQRRFFRSSRQLSCDMVTHIKCGLATRVTGIWTVKSGDPEWSSVRLQRHRAAEGRVLCQLFAAEQWKRDLVAEYGRLQNSHGPGSSPTQTEDLVILNIEHRGPSFLLALQKRTGATAWRSDRPSGTSRTSPIVPEFGSTQDAAQSNLCLTPGENSRLAPPAGRPLSSPARTRGFSERMAAPTWSDAEPTSTGSVPISCGIRRIRRSLRLIAKAKAVPAVLRHRLKLPHQRKRGEAVRAGEWRQFLEKPMQMLTAGS